MRVGSSLSWFRFCETEEVPNYMFLDWKGQKVRRTSRWQLWGPGLLFSPAFGCKRAPACRAASHSASLQSSSCGAAFWVTQEIQSLVRGASPLVCFFFSPFLPWVEPSYFHFFLPIPSFFLLPFSLFQHLLSNHSASNTGDKRTKKW